MLQTVQCCLACYVTLLHVSDFAAKLQAATLLSAQTMHHLSSFVMLCFQFLHVIEGGARSCNRVDGKAMVDSVCNPRYWLFELALCDAQGCNFRWPSEWVDYYKFGFPHPSAWGMQQRWESLLKKKKKCDQQALLLYSLQGFLFAVQKCLNLACWGKLPYLQKCAELCRVRNVSPNASPLLCCKSIVPAHRF